MPKNRSLTTRIYSRVRRGAKHGYWKIFRTERQNQLLVFIFGCQRSGTTMLLELFEKDLRSRTLGEYSCITDVGNNSIRLKALADVRDVINSSGEPLIVCKPLVESQRTAEILDYFPGSRALWAYRSYVDAINSNINAFQSQIEACRIVVDKEPGNWRSEVVPQVSMALIHKYYQPNMSPNDAAALMWHARNSLYFEQKLFEHPAVRLWKYEAFVKGPLQNTREMYRWLGMNAPSPRVCSFVRSGSIGLGRGIDLNKDIDAACQALLARLDTHYSSMAKT